MSLKKVQAKRDELTKKQEALASFVAIATKMTEALERIKKAEDEASKAHQDLHAKRLAMSTFAEKIETHGIKEFEQIKASMVAFCGGGAHQLRLLPLAPAKKVVDAAKKEHAEMLSAWFKKQAASVPKLLKKGMTFHDYTKDRIYEMLADEEPIAEADLKTGQRNGSTRLKTKYEELKTGKIQIEELMKEDFTTRTLKLLNI